MTMADSIVYLVEYSAIVRSDDIDDDDVQITYH